MFLCFNYNMALLASTQIEKWDINQRREKIICVQTNFDRKYLRWGVWRDRGKEGSWRYHTIIQKRKRL